MKEFIKEHKFKLIKLLVTLCLIIAATVSGVFNSQASFIIYIASYVLISYKTIFLGIKALFKNAEINERLLMTVATLGAIITESYFEASLVLFLFEIGELIEAGAKRYSKMSLAKLQAIRPDRARPKGKIDMVSVDEINVGDIIEIFPGERIPLDGVCIDGVSTVDSSIITGESTPEEVRHGKDVFAGCLNLNGVLYVKVVRLSSQSVAQRIIDLAEGASEKKTKGERFITKFARIYTPIIVFLALIVALIPPIFAGSMADWAYKAFSMLAISCPCAIVISVPLAYYCAVGYASRKGILLKGLTTLEKLEELNTLAFDKTGTLTKSDLHVTKLEAFEGYTKIKLLELACIAEYKSNHPLAQALRNEAKRFKIDVKEGTNYLEQIGAGIECDSEYGHIKAGSKVYVGAVTQTNVGTVFVSVNGKYIGYVGVGDDLKPNSKRAFEKLRLLGIEKMFIVSGDKKAKVDLVASTLYADGAYSQLLPENKLDALEDIIATHENVKIGYCGDGINDVPCLSRADVGISMGAIGSDAAVEKGDVIIMDDDLEKIPLAIKIAKNTKRTVITNIIGAISLKALLLVLNLFIPLPMWVAVLGDVGIMLVAILNALRAGK